VNLCELTANDWERGVNIEDLVIKAGGVKGKIMTDTERQELVRLNEGLNRWAFGSPPRDKRRLSLKEAVLEGRKAQRRMKRFGHYD